METFRVGKTPGRRCKPAGRVEELRVPIPDGQRLPGAFSRMRSRKRG